MAFSHRLSFRVFEIAPLTFFRPHSAWNPQSDEFGRAVVRLKYDRKAWIRSPFDSERYSVPDALAKGGVRLAQAFKDYKNDVRQNLSTPL
jgi:hypothetical protein